MQEIVVGRNKGDLAKYGLKGTVLLGKHYITMGQTTTLSSKIYMDVAGAHVFFICGKRGSGKCLTGDTLITLNDGREIQIKDLYETYSKAGKLDSSKEEYYKLTENLLVKSFDLNKKCFVDKKVTHVFRRKVKEKLVKWIFPKGKNGEKITLVCTQDHKLLGLKETSTGEGFVDEFVWSSYKHLEYFEYVTAFKENIPYEGYFNKIKIEDDKKNIELINYDDYVYDLTIQDTHNFVANGIVVHNSYTMGTIAEGFYLLDEDVKKNLAVVLLDTMGIYWTMKYPNHQDKILLEEWGLKPQSIPIVIFTPEKYYHIYKEKGIPTDHPFTLAPFEIDQDDWCNAFKLNKYSPEGILISDTILELKKSGEKYSMSDIIQKVRNNTEAEKGTKDEVIAMFKIADNWGVFSETGTQLSDLVRGGQIAVLDVSCYATMPGGWDVKALIVGLVSQRLFINRMEARKGEEFDSVMSATNFFSKEAVKKQDMPLVWLVIDEAHEFLPVKGKVASTDALVTIMREGRQPGISLILATQQPGKIHTDVMTQSDIVLSHRITAKIDVDALGLLMQSYMRTGLVEATDRLPRVQGSGILFDDNNEKMYPMRVKPRFTWHGGSSPTAVPKEKDNKKNELDLL